MAGQLPRRTRAVNILPPEMGSLARGLPAAAPGTLFALGPKGGISVAPTAAFTVVFGRNEPEVHVCVGTRDPQMSRRQGTFRCDEGRWSIRNIGYVPIRVPGSGLLLSGHEQELAGDYTPLFIRTAPGREHLLEVRIAGRTTPHHEAGVDDSTSAPVTWTLTDRERLVLVALGQRYLRHEVNPQPMTWGQAAAELDELQPGAGWTGKQAAHLVTAVRERLARRGVPGLTREEVGEPVGNALNHNLLCELLQSTTLVAPDLELLD